MSLEKDYIPFLEALYRQNGSIDCLSALSIYRRWLHSQGFRDWKDWEDFVEIVTEKSALWDLQYLSRRNEQDQGAFNDDWYELGYWGYWDSAIHYLDVWIDFNEPWEDLDEDIAKLSCENLIFSDEKSKAKNFLKDRQPLREGLDFMTEEVKAQIKQIDARTANILRYVEQQISDLGDKGKQSADFDHKYLSLELELERNKAQLEIVISDRDFLKHENTQLVNQVAANTAERNRFEQQNSELRVSLSNLEYENKRLDSHNSRFQGSLDEAHQQNENLCARLDKAQDQLSAQNQKNKDLFIQIDKLNQEKENISSQLNCKEEELRQCTEEWQLTLQKKAELEESFSRNADSLETLQKEYDKLHSHFEGANALVEQLKEEKIRFESKLAEKEEQLKQFESENGNLRGLVESNFNERKQLHDQRTEFQQLLDKAQEDKVDLQDEISELKRLHEEASYQVTLLRDRLFPSLNTLTTQVQELSSKQLSIDAQIVLTQLTIQLNDIQEQLKQIYPVALPLLQQLRQEELRLKNELSNAEAQLQNALQELSTCNNQLTEKTFQYQQSQQSLELTARECSNIQSRLFQSEKQVQALQEQLHQEQQNTSRIRIERTGLQNQLLASEEQLVNTKEELKQVQQQLGECQLDRENLNTEQTELQSQLVISQRDLEHTQRQLEQVRQDNQSLSQERAMAVDNLREREGTITQLLNRNAEFVASLRQCQDQLSETQAQFSRKLDELTKKESAWNWIFQRGRQDIEKLLKRND
jgi:chromosome segregation ATPase